MVPDIADIDPPPDYELIGNRKGKRATDEEKEEIYRLAHEGMKLVQIMEITQRSEDSIRRYIREVDAAVNSEVRAQAAAYQHMTTPQQPPRQADDDDDDEEPPPSRTTARLPAPEPPELEIDLDDLFEEDELVDPTDEDALPKKLFLLLTQKGAVKELEEARDIAQTWRMFPDYQSPHGLVEFLRSHGVKERKANLVARLLYGWQSQSTQQPGWNPAPVPGGYPMGYPGTSTPGQPSMPGQPGFPFPQQYPGGQPTLPGQYPFPWPQPQPQQPPQPSGDRVTKKDIQSLVTKAVEDRDNYWKDYLDKMEAKREKDEEKKKLQEIIDNQNSMISGLREEIRDMKTNPQTAPPDGNYEAIEEPEHDEEGNLIRVRTRYVKLEDPIKAQIENKYDQVLAELKEERKEAKAQIDAILQQKNQIEIEKMKAENEGELKIWRSKNEQLDQLHQQRMEMDNALREREKQIMELQNQKDGEQSEEMQKVDKQLQFVREVKEQVREGRRDLIKFFTVMSGRGRPDGVVEEQWSDEELRQLQG